MVRIGAASLAVPALLASFLALCGQRAALADEVVADLSEHLIAITTGFTGTEVTLFGAVDAPGDVAVVVRGPSEATTVRLKERVAGIWINTRSVTFEQVPGFYSVAVNRPVDDIAPATVLARHAIGLEHLIFGLSGEVPPMVTEDGRQLSEDETEALFRAALIRNMQRNELYVPEEQTVSFLGDSLFRARVVFPSSVPTGQYTVSVYLIREGEIVSAQTTPLVVSKIGFGAAVFDFANRYPPFYGLAAIAIAVFAGWLASVAFRRR
ncbi:MAG: TIGR02186 family protein [Azospirillaceae bacterium]